MPKPRIASADLLPTPLASGLVSYVDSLPGRVYNYAAYVKTLRTVFEAPFSGDAYFMASSFEPIFMNLTRIRSNGTAMVFPESMIHCDTYSGQVPYRTFVFKRKYHIYRML